MAEKLGDHGKKSTLIDRMQSEAETMEFLPPVDPAQAEQQAAFVAYAKQQGKPFNLDDLSDLSSEQG